MVLDFFRFKGIKSFVSGYDFEGIEPFTLIVVESRTETFLYELRWDGHKLQFKKLGGLEPRIWSSATLYTWETISQRQTWFKKWLRQHPKFTEEAILNFHHFAGSDDPANSLIMKREDQKQTVSITSIQINRSGYKMAYEDLLLNQVTHCTIPAEMAENIC